MNKQQLFGLCEKTFTEKGFVNDKKYVDRFSYEWKEITNLGEIEYFSELVEKKIRFAFNENNLLIPYLLGIVDDFDIARDVKYNYGDWPDVDVDYIDCVREYLKEDFAKKQFGSEYVCNIANYNTYGMKSALKDMARIFSLPHEEVDVVTKNIKDKDDDGKLLTWDQALEIFDDFRQYCEAHPEVADAAKRLVGRIRNHGQHASGLVISRVPIHEHIPLIRGKDGSVSAAWPEGLHGTDLSTVGFVKFDFLSLDANQKIFTACKLACEDKQIRREAKLAESLVSSAIGNNTVCALPGQPSWSDTSYLNDPKCMEIANRGDLRLVFQFDGSPGIRNMALEGGVDRFEDLVAYTSLFRPGPMKLKAHEQYIKRKRGTEKWNVHPALANGPANLDTTYGVLVYQEQVMRMLNTVGKIPLGDCEAVRKAISHKKIERFKKYKEMFITNGQETIEATVEELEHLWKLIEAFAGYGFNLAHAVGYCYISSRMLWLKAHMPKQFFASMFTHTKATGPKDYVKLKEYKREAERNNVEIASLDINKSKKDFVISEDGKMYWGFSKIKGIGEEVAERIENLQPFAGITDFLQRFGTDAKACQAVIALGCFKEADPITLFRFYEHFKDYEKKELSRHKRFQKNKENMELEILTTENEDDKRKLMKKLEISIANKSKKDEFSEAPTLENFNHEFKLKDEILKILSDPTGEKAQEVYVGFVWQHPIEKLPTYEGHTIQHFNDSNEKDGIVEVLIKTVKKVKGPKVTYYSVQIEDATYKQRKVNVWEDDYSRFSSELQEGNFARLHLDIPKPPYPTFSLHQFPGNKWRKPSRECDKRIIPLT